MNKNQTEQPKTKILIADDIPANRDLLRKTLEPEGYDVFLVPSGEIALKVAHQVKPDLILLDIAMPKGIDGFETCHRLKQDESTKDIPVIFITVKDEMESMVQAFRVGGVDYITKSFEKEEVHIRVETHLKINRLTQELLQKNRELQNEITRREQVEDALMKADEHLSMISQQEASRWGIAGFVGQSKTIRKILEDVRRLQSTETTSVLITGESGTGKELIARAIHFGGTRAKSPFIPVNCSAIPRELAESTLFGHVRGAFTGANTSHKGYFELANGGTLFLDEIGSMPSDLQTKFLRVLEDGCIVPIGGTHQKHVDVRIITATNADLQTELAEGTFREDLYYRLARFPVNVPPLRDRREDIPLLANHFLSMFASEMGLMSRGSIPVHQTPTISPEALETLEAYHFPGNVRELKNIIEYALIKNGGSIIMPEHLPILHNSGVATASSPQKESPATDSHQLPPHTQPLLFQDIDETDTPAHFLTDEERILAYLKKHGSINNTECRDFLNVDIHRASYLLKKMYGEDQLERINKRRWARYRLRKSKP